MITISHFQSIEFIIGFFSFWVGTYQLSQNIKSYFSWLIFFFFFATGFTVLADPIIYNTLDYHTYIHWQKLTDWPLFLMPVLCLHIATSVSNKIKKLKPMLAAGYLFTIFLFFVDIKGGLILKEGIIRYSDFRRIDSFAPGILMIPFVIYCIVYFLVSAYQFNWVRKQKKNNKFLLAILGLIILTISAILTGTSYYTYIPNTTSIFNIGVATGELLLICFILSYYQLVNNERNIFDRSFVYRTLLLGFVILAYTSTFISGRNRIDFTDLVFMVFLVLLIIISHSLYEWINTFINDLLYNPQSGLSVVTDEEIYQVIKNYSSPEKLDNNSLQRLKIISKKIRSDNDTPIDTLKQIVKNSIDYFKPIIEEDRRIKKNLKYQILKMIAFDQSEEGQILWELGFDEYPVAIMTRENKDRKPMFQTESPSDYFYISRNAYLALKKEAIHDVAWRISYLEKLAKHS